ncbi:MAG: pilus assembly FimT family protein [Vicinamibacterales bacterium]
MLELLLTLAVATTMMAIAIPLTSNALDEARTAMAARYLEGRIMDARMHAVSRSARVALRFEPSTDDYQIAEYLDGNGNGVRTAEISAGVDSPRAPRQFLRDSFSGVAFGLQPGVPDVDGSRAGGGVDGVRMGTSRLLTLAPDGTSSSGTLYVRGRRGQYAVRVLGATGRTRVLRFDAGAGQWVSR